MLLENILQMEIEIIDIKFILLFCYSYKKKIYSHFVCVYGIETALHLHCTRRCNARKYEMMWTTTATKFMKFKTFDVLQNCCHFSITIAAFQLCRMFFFPCERNKNPFHFPLLRSILPKL